jgi:hypothetical protein
MTAPLAILWNPRSSNSKTGPIPVSTTAKASCPTTCPFRGNGCYAESGPLAMLWNSMSDAGPNASFPHGAGRMRTTSWAGLCDEVAKLPEGQLWRHNQAGDLPHGNGRIDDLALSALILANLHSKAKGFTYTHHDVETDEQNRLSVRFANADGFTINLSANSLAHADTLAALDAGPVVTVLPADTLPAWNAPGPRGKGPTGLLPRLETPQGRKVVICPATYRDDVSCASCKLCAIAERDFIIGFPAHGSSKRKASAVAEGTPA